MRRILLWDIPDEIMLIVEYASGVAYQNQVGGVVCWQAALEGLLAPLDIGAKDSQRIRDLPYPSGREGLSAEIADTIDGVLASAPSTKFLKVDRARLLESWEAWVYVLVACPVGEDPTPAEPYFGPIYGFGDVRGVLTWPNSD